MNCLLLFENEKRDHSTYVVANQSRIAHISKHLKKNVGDSLKICLVNIGLTSGVIKDLSPHSLEIEISDNIQTHSFPHIKLIVAVSRPPTMKKVIEHGTSLGVSEFHFFPSQLTEKSYLTSKTLEKDQFQNLSELGLSQSRYFYKMPSLQLHQTRPNLETFKEDQLFILSHLAKRKLSHFKMQEKPITFAIGPERGFTEEEMQNFSHAGFHPIFLSPSTLRVEIATFSVLSQFGLLQGDKLVNI